MAAKGKRAKAPEVAHLNDAQLSELGGVVWDFLVSEVGSAEAAFRLKPKKIKDCAKNFLYSDDGSLYWPLSDMNQWQYDATQAEVEKWIADLMARERSSHEAKSSTILVDDPMEGPSSQTNFPTPSKAQSRAAKIVTTLKSPPKLNERPRDSHKSKPSPQEAALTTRLSKSPTAVPDIPYADPPEFSNSTPRRSIRPTPGSIKIANETFDGSIVPNATIEISTERSATMGPSLHPSPATPRKRAAEEIAEDLPTLESAEPQSKRPASNAVRSPSGVSSTKVSLSQSVRPLVPQPSEPIPVASPPNQNSQSTVAQIISNDQAERLATVTAYGLPFTLENLARIPETILGYVIECVHHQIRLANETSNESLKNESRARATLLQNMHADLDSRVKFLAQDAQEKRRVESSHCLWN